jgi:hypothetical protein
VLFQKLVEQHRVDLVVAHRVDFAFTVADDQVGIHLFHILGHQPKLRHALRVNLLLIMEGNGLEREERFAGLVHRLNVIFEPPGRNNGAQLTRSINDDGGCSGRSHTENVADVTGIAHVLAIGADSNNVIGRADTRAGVSAQGDIPAAGAVQERLITDSRVVDADGVLQERSNTVGRVEETGDVAKERSKTVGCVVGADCVGAERIKTVGRVVATGGIAKERLKTVGRVAAAGGVAGKRIKTGGRVAAAGRVFKESSKTSGRVGVAFGVEIERSITVGSIEAGGCVVGERISAVALLKNPLVLLKSDKTPVAVL